MEDDVEHKQFLWLEIQFKLLKFTWADTLSIPNFQVLLKIYFVVSLYHQEEDVQGSEGP